MDGDGHFNPEVVYLFQTSDGCDVLARGTGHVPNVFILFETACEKYDWLNNVVSYGLAAPVADGIKVEVFEVSDVLRIAWTNVTVECANTNNFVSLRLACTRTRGCELLAEARVACG